MAGEAEVEEDDEEAEASPNKLTTPLDWLLDPKTLSFAFVLSLVVLVVVAQKGTLNVNEPIGTHITLCQLSSVF